MDKIELDNGIFKPDEEIISYPGHWTTHKGVYKENRSDKWVKATLNLAWEDHSAIWNDYELILKESEHITYLQNEMSEGWAIKSHNECFSATKEYKTLNNETVQIVIHISGIYMIKDSKQVNLYSWDEETVWFLEEHNIDVRKIFSKNDINDMLGSGRVLIES